MLKRKAAADALAEVDLFSGIAQSALERLASAAHERQFSAGQAIFLRGDTGRSLFIVVAGRVRLSIVSPEGRELTLRHAEPGGIFGEMALIDHEPRSADATALVATSLLEIRQPQFQALRDDDPQLDRALVQALCARLRGTTDQLESVALLPLDMRLARLFIQFAHAAGQVEDKALVPLEISQSELAALIGASRPKVNQLLSLWQDRGIIERRPGALVLDLDALADVASPDA